jgi:hypothetical protein
MLLHNFTNALGELTAELLNVNTEDTHSYYCTLNVCVVYAHRGTKLKND